MCNQDTRLVPQKATDAPETQMRRSCQVYHLHISYIMLELDTVILFGICFSFCVPSYSISLESNRKSRTSFNCLPDTSSTAPLPDSGLVLSNNGNLFLIFIMIQYRYTSTPFFTGTFSCTDVMPKDFFEAFYQGVLTRTIQDFAVC